MIQRDSSVLREHPQCMYSIRPVWYLFSSYFFGEEGIECIEKKNERKESIQEDL